MRQNLTLYAGRNSMLLRLSGLTRTVDGETTPVDDAAVTATLTPHGGAALDPITLPAIGGGDYEVQIPTADALGLNVGSQVGVLLHAEADGLEFERAAVAKVRPR